jgi:hypothetical protein
VDGNHVEHVPAPVEREVGFVALYDVFNFELHQKSPEQIWYQCGHGKLSRLALASARKQSKRMILKI